MYVRSALSRDERLSRVTRYAYGILALTSAHHAYGAWLYATPWRLHVVGLSLAAAMLIGGSAWIHRRYVGFGHTLAFWILCVVTFVFPFVMIGLFEGGYNHVLKNILYFEGASGALMQRLFPAPTYELPNSVVFEATGIAQFPVALLGLLHLYRLVVDSFAGRNRMDVGVRPPAAASLDGVP
jgi:hypothetical protein